MFRQSFEPAEYCAPRVPSVSASIAAMRAAAREAINWPPPLGS